MHPHRKAAAESSRDKFKAITGVSGGGHAFEGSSHSKRAAKDGEIKSWNGHHKTHLGMGDERAHGGKSKARGDRFARGGRTHEHEDTPGGPLGGSSARREIEAGNRQSRGNAPAPTGAWAPKELSEDHPASNRKSFLARGGKARDRVKADLPKDLSEHVNYEGEHWKMHDTTGKHSPEEEKRIRANAKKPQYEGKAAEIGRIDTNDPLFRKIMGKGATDSSGLSEADKRGIVDGNRGGRMHRHKRADGGGVSVSGSDNPFEGKKSGKGKSGKAPREVTINITASPQPQAPPPPPPPMPPPGGAPGGAPPPAPMPPPGGAGGAGAGGGNPLMSALGKGMGGMARGGRAMGGRTHPDKHGNESLTHKDGLKEWRDRANRNTQLKAEERIGRAAGGRMTAGALSGEGRLEKAEHAKSRRK